MDEYIFFAPPFDWRAEVINSGKPSHQRDADIKLRSGRFGGLQRQPRFHAAYVHAARLLVTDAEREDALDELALPIFYLQRHATELLLKHLLSWMYETMEFRRLALWADQAIPEARMKRYRSKHSLPALFEDLQQTALELELPAPPAAIGDLVQSLRCHERNDSWARYAATPSGESHHPDEVSVPLAALQVKLESANYGATYSVDDADNYENVLYDAWFRVALHLGKVA